MLVGEDGGRSGRVVEDDVVCGGGDVCDGSVFLCDDLYELEGV